MSQRAHHKNRPRPFLKWAGGKRSLAQQVLALLPERIETYVEPFLGGGAIFLALAREGRLARARLSDRNPELVTTWRAVRDEPEALIEAIGAIGPGTKTLYYDVRDRVESEPVAIAARLIWLNRHCYNGLYRLNRSGKFNVPYGAFKSPPRIDFENIRAVSALLVAHAVEIEQLDFEEALAHPLTERDAIYCDPPYLPASATSNFTAYDRLPFGALEHARLAATFAALALRGVPALLSNADTPDARALYAAHDLSMTAVSAPRPISSNGATRGPAREILVAAPRRG